MPALGNLSLRGNKMEHDDYSSWATANLQLKCLDFKPVGNYVSKKSKRKERGAAVKRKEEKKQGKPEKVEVAEDGKPELTEEERAARKAAKLARKAYGKELV